MRFWSVVIGVHAGVLLAAGNAFATECPEHIATAEQRIEQVARDVRGMAGMLAPEAAAWLASLLDQARALLNEARTGHESAQNPYDHALAIANADSALAFAEVADTLHAKVMIDH
jgi:hypothetical protein